MNQPLLPPQLLGQVLPEEVITILRGSVQLRINDIIRLEAERNYTRFILAESFVRVHKSHLLNRRYINDFGKLQVQM